MNVIPKVIHLRDVDCGKLEFADGRASFRPVVYENENVFVHIPKSSVVGVDEFRDDKGMPKHYLCLDVTDIAELFEGLCEWLGQLGTQTHPIIRERFGRMVLKMKIPAPDDKTNCPGIFDDASKPISLHCVKPGCFVETVAHIGNVWTMRGTTGLTMSAAQIKTYRRQADCLITDIDYQDESSSFSLNAGSKCMIVG